MKKGKELNKTKTEIMEACIRAFGEEIRIFVMEMDPKTFQQMLSFARTTKAIRGSSRRDSAGKASLPVHLGGVRATM